MEKNKKRDDKYQHLVTDDEFSGKFSSMKALQVSRGGLYDATLCVVILRKIVNE